jgi:hypothetical protein
MESMPARLTAATFGSLSRAVLVLILALACDATQREPEAPASGLEPEARSEAESEIGAERSDRGAEVEVEARGRVGDADVAAACSTCHAPAPPGILPRSSWRGVIEHMAVLGADPDPATGPNVAIDVEAFVAWYEARAPEALPERRMQSREGPSPLRFRRRAVLLGPGSGPGVATVERVPADVAPDLAPSLAATNMASGNVHLFSLQHGPLKVGNAGHPVRAVPADLDGDGRSELVISDLGNPMPTDEPVGRVLVARGVGERRFAVEEVLEGVGRVADARAVDLDRDGDLDLVVGAFGMLRSGGVYVLHSEDGSFRVEKVSDRPGAVSVVPVEDLRPGDGPGFVVAFAQHHETISAFHPREGGGFEERVLYRAPHPNWGTSNLEPVDLDRDGDLDFLLCHGDTLDDGIAIKPYHGVEWLENRGAEGFVARPIGPLYGAHRAEAADLDGDGDLDVVATGFLPQVQLPVPEGAPRLDSVLWFERTEEGWTPWSLEANHPRHTGLTILDIDEDGDPDVVAPINTAWDLAPEGGGPSLEVWFNEGPTR